MDLYKGRHHDKTPCMIVGKALIHSLSDRFQAVVAETLLEQGWIDSPEQLSNPRFINRSVAPHIQKLLERYTIHKMAEFEGTNYWKLSSNPKNFRLAYFLHSFPQNLYRIAAIWGELHRHGYTFQQSEPLRGLDFGAGQGAACSGIALAETLYPCDLPSFGHFALIEKDKGNLNFATLWCEKWFQEQANDWTVKNFHRDIDWQRGLLPRSAPSFNLWLMSYFLSEVLDGFDETQIKEFAETFMSSLETHLEMRGIVIISDSSLRPQSRQLLLLRQELIEIANKKNFDWFKILLPCLGTQACDALKDETDWCHEEVNWWRPSTVKMIDDSLDLKNISLPFSHLVIAKDDRPLHEILPKFHATQKLHRVVSEPKKMGGDFEIFTCGGEGKRRARISKSKVQSVSRGSVLIEPEFKGSKEATRIMNVREIH